MGELLQTPYRISITRNTAPLSSSIISFYGIHCTYILAPYHISRFIPFCHYRLPSFAPIATFDERFARQYRYELPPNFHPVSFYAAIVHHLSGPNISTPWSVFQDGRIHKITISSPISLSFQSSFHLSITFLLRVQSQTP
ncbi:hypothetical protein M0811_14354 [Anaeramoeba ignava]|nr:hypothetical protein M0811_14468 [Anaeramoeba ignava]KAJ5079618.1 hypothetical protein M0811_14360 [Anaeramoeba ignava]KAJ5079633.1 hypothetical protein M0811_14354 [Anaeramoeba ignava]